MASLPGPGSFDLPQNFGGHKSLQCCSVRPAFNAFDFVRAHQSFSFKKCALDVFVCVLLCVCLCGLVGVWQAVCV